MIRKRPIQSFLTTYRAVVPHSATQTKRMSMKLLELGIQEPVKLQGTYDTGQMFIHRVLGYKGVVLFPWSCRVHDKDITDNVATRLPSSGKLLKAEVALRRKNSNNNNTVADKEESDTAGKKDEGGTVSKEADRKEGLRHHYYQVLVDERDMEHARLSPQLVSYLYSTHDGTRTVRYLHALDYVAHEDIVFPFKPSRSHQMQHKHFNTFFHMNEKTGCYEGKEELLLWKSTYLQFLHLRDVYKKTTEDIRITVMPFYLGSSRGSHQDGEQHHWRYMIRMENLGTEPVQLRERFWSVFSKKNNELNTVRGRGVVGHEPILDPSKPAFQYCSHVSLDSLSGDMWGSFRFERADTDLEVRIPNFQLNRNAD